MEVIKEPESDKIKETKRKINLINLSHLARSIGISVNHIHLVLRGDARISHKIAYDVSEVTNNFIEMNEILELGEYVFNKRQIEKNG